MASTGDTLSPPAGGGSVLALLNGILDSQIGNECMAVRRVRDNIGILKADGRLQLVVWLALLL
jgi:hypothetical protein